MGWTRSAVAAVVLLCGATQVRAVSAPGAVCTPGDPAIQANRYFVTAGSVNYRTGASGLVTLYCPAYIPYCGDHQHTMRLTYTDSDGAGGAVSVQAQLIRLSVANGSFLGPVAGGQILSNFSNATTSTSQVTSPFDFDYDFTREMYYVRVDMNRAAGTPHVATLYGVGLECEE